jgi:hypothetical protein
VTNDYHNNDLEYLFAAVDEERELFLSTHHQHYLSLVNSTILLGQEIETGRKKNER